MKRITFFVLLLLSPALLAAGPVFSQGDSCRIVVTCAVPAIPGVNAPALLEEEALKAASTEPAEKKAYPQEGTPEPSFATIADEQVGEVELPEGEGESSLMLVRTVYPR